jgi:hypothetical protein
MKEKFILLFLLTCSSLAFSQDFNYSYIIRGESYVVVDSINVEKIPADLVAVKKEGKILSIYNPMNTSEVFFSASIDFIRLTDEKRLMYGQRLNDNISLILFLDPLEKTAEINVSDGKNISILAEFGKNKTK